MKFEPMNPQPPVTRIFMCRQPLRVLARFAGHPDARQPASTPWKSAPIIASKPYGHK